MSFLEGLLWIGLLKDDGAVKRAVEAGQIAFSRYESYIEMRAESLESREFE